MFCATGHTCTIIIILCMVCKGYAVVLLFCERFCTNYFSQFLGLIQREITALIHNTHEKCSAVGIKCAIPANNFFHKFYMFLFLHAGIYACANVYCIGPRVCCVLYGCFMSVCENARINNQKFAVFIPNICWFCFNFCYLFMCLCVCFSVENENNCVLY